MEKLKIQKESIGISKTFRFPKDIINEINTLAEIKNISFNRTISYFLRFALEHLDEADKRQIEMYKKMKKQ